jgi:hypothetical protein
MTVNQFTNKKFSGYWVVKSINEGKEIIDSLKITGKGSTFNIEDDSGLVIFVISK